MPGPFAIMPTQHDELGQLLAIERESFDHPWDADDFSRHFYAKSCLSFTAWIGHEMVGFVFTTKSDKSLLIDNLAVTKSRRRSEVATCLIDHCRHLGVGSGGPFDSLLTAVDDANLGAQLFYAAIGFRCTDIMGTSVTEHGSARQLAYVFEWTTNWRKSMRCGEFFVDPTLRTKR